MGTMAKDAIPRQKPVSFELLMLLLSPGNSPAPKVEEIKHICEAADHPSTQPPSPNHPSNKLTGNSPVKSSNHAAS